MSVYPVCEWYAFKLYVENSTFGIIMSWSSQVGSGQVTALLVIGDSGRVVLEIWRVGSGRRNWTCRHL